MIKLLTIPSEYIDIISLSSVCLIQVDSGSCSDYAVCDCIVILDYVIAIIGNMTTIVYTLYDEPDMIEYTSKVSFYIIDEDPWFSWLIALK